MVTSAAAAALGAEVDDVVGALDDVEIVLNDEHRVPCVHEPLQDREQPPHVVGVRVTVGRGGRRGFVTGAALAGLYMSLGYAASCGFGGLPFSPAGMLSMLPDLEAMELFSLMVTVTFSVMDVIF